MYFLNIVLYNIISVFSCLWQLFLEAAAQCCENHNVQPTEVFVQKMIQTYEMMIVRHGYVIQYFDFPCYHIWISCFLCFQLQSYFT